MPSSPGPKKEAWEPQLIMEHSPRRRDRTLAQPFMVENDRGLSKDEIQIVTDGGQKPDIPTGSELEAFRPFAHYFHPSRYGVQKWRLFKIRIPMKIQKQLHSFLDGEESVAESIQYWGARMVHSFGAPKNLMLSILTDYTWFTTLLLVEALVEGKLDALREVLFAAYMDRKHQKPENVLFGEVRREYFNTINVMKDQLRYMTEESQSVKAACDAMLAQVCGPDDVEFINSEVWLNLDDTQKELLKMFLRDKLKAAFQSGRQAMKQVMADTVQNMVNAQRERDAALKKAELMQHQKEELEIALAQRDKLITALKGSGGNAEFLDQIQALQDKIKQLQDFFRTTEQEKLALENKIRKLEEAGAGGGVVAAMMPIDDQESTDDLKKQLAALKQQLEAATREKRELEKKLRLAEKEVERMGNFKADTSARAADANSKPGSRPGSSSTGKNAGGGDMSGDFAMAEIANLEKELSLLRDKCDGLEAQMDGVQGENMDLKAENARLMAELAAAKKDAASARKEAAKLEGKLGKMEGRMAEMAEHASAAGVAIPVAESSPGASPTSRGMSSPDDLDNIDTYRPMDSDTSRLPSREKSHFGGSRAGTNQVESEEEWVFPGEAPLNARSEPREVRVQGLSGYKIKEVDDKVAKITEIESGKEFRVQRKIVEKRTWVFVDAHPDTEELQAVKKMRPGTVPVPEAMLPVDPESPLEVARQVAGVPYAHSLSSGSKPGSRGGASSIGGRPRSQPASSVGSRPAGSHTGSMGGGQNGSQAGGSDSDREWNFRDLGNDQGEIVYAGTDDKKRGQSYKIQNKVQEKKNVYVPIEENPILNDQGDPVAQELTIEQVLNPDQMRRNADRFEVVGAEEGNTRVVVDKETKEQFVMQKATRVEVDPKTQQIRRLEKLVSQLRAELDEKEAYAKKLEAAVTELQSKFTDMKQALAKAGVKSNLIDAALKDSGITNLLFGAKSIRKVYERLYQDALDRMIRQENRAGKHWSGQQRSLMSVLHTSGGQDMSADDQRRMYQEFYKGFETFEAALQKRARSSAIIRKASPKSSPKRYRSSEETRRNLNAYVASNFYQPPGMHPGGMGMTGTGGGMTTITIGGQTTQMNTVSRLSATMSTDEPSFQTRSLLAGESSLVRTQLTTSLSPRGGPGDSSSLRMNRSLSPPPDQHRGAVRAESSSRRLVEDGGMETLRIGEPGPRLGSRENALRVRDPRSGLKQQYQTPVRTNQPLYYGDPPGGRGSLGFRSPSPALVPHEIGAGLNVASFNLLSSPTLGGLGDSFAHTVSVESEKPVSGQNQGQGPVGSALRNTGQRARGLTPGTSMVSTLQQGLSSALDHESLRVGREQQPSRGGPHMAQSAQMLRRGPAPRSASPEMINGPRISSGGHFASAQPAVDLTISTVGSAQAATQSPQKKVLVAQLPTPKRLEGTVSAAQGGQPRNARGFLVDDVVDLDDTVVTVPSMHITSYESTSSVELTGSSAIGGQAAKNGGAVVAAGGAGMKHSASVTLPIINGDGAATSAPSRTTNGNAAPSSSKVQRSPRPPFPPMGREHFVKKQPSQQRFSNRMKFLVSMNNPSGLPDGDDQNRTGP